MMVLLYSKILVSIMALGSPSALPSPSPQILKKKKIHPQKAKRNSLFFRKWNFLALMLKKFLYFLKKELFLERFFYTE